MMSLDLPEQAQMGNGGKRLFSAAQMLEFARQAAEAQRNEIYERLYNAQEYGCPCYQIALETPLVTEIQ